MRRFQVLRIVCLAATLAAETAGCALAEDAKATGRPAADVCRRHSGRPGVAHPEPD